MCYAICYNNYTPYYIQYKDCFCFWASSLCKNKIYLNMHFDIDNQLTWTQNLNQTWFNECPSLYHVHLCVIYYCDNNITCSLFNKYIILNIRIFISFVLFVLFQAIETTICMFCFTQSQIFCEWYSYMYR